MSHRLERELLFQERSIKTWIEQLDISFDEILADSVRRKDDLSNATISELIVKIKKQKFKELAERLYPLCVAYFESRKLPMFVVEFERTIKPFYSEDQLYSSRPIYYEGESPCVLTHAYSNFLNAFPQFGSVNRDLTGLDFLENILSSTAFILRKAGVIPKKEADVYNAVKTVCEATFPKANFIEGHEPFPFLSTAKFYKPDILIRSLECAIEYKFARDNDDLTIKIDQIKEDVTGYSKTVGFTLFYAVFYMPAGLVPISKAEQLWKERNFPENWKPIFVEGHS